MITRRDAVGLAALTLATAPICTRAQTPVASPTADPPIVSVPMFRANAARTGQMPGPAPDFGREIVVKWRAGQSDEYLQAHVLEGSTLIASSYAGQLLALNWQTGEELWRREYNVGRGAMCMLGGTLYSAVDDSMVMAIEVATAREMWRKDLAGAISMVAFHAETLVCSTEQYMVFGMEPSTGEELWTLDPWNRVGMAAFSNGAMYLPFMNSSVAEVDVKSGELMWSTELGGSPFNPCLAGNLVVMGSTSGWVYAVDRTTHDVIWRYETGQSAFMGATDETNLYIEAGDSGVTAVQLATGEKLWNFTLGEWLGELLLVDGAVLTTNDSAHADETIVYVLDKVTGATRHEIHLESGRSLDIVIDGTFIFTGMPVMSIGNLQQVVLRTDVVLRGAPSSTAIERGRATAGTEIASVGEQRQSPDGVWVEVNIDGVPGWIPLDAIDPTTLPPDGEIEYVYVPK